MLVFLMLVTLQMDGLEEAVLLRDQLRVGGRQSKAQLQGFEGVPF